MREWFNAVVDFLIQMGVWAGIGFVAGFALAWFLGIRKADKRGADLRDQLNDWHAGVLQETVREARPAPRSVRDTQVLRRNLEDAETVVIEMNGDQND